MGSKRKTALERARIRLRKLKGDLKKIDELHKYYTAQGYADARENVLRKIERVEREIRDMEGR